MQNAAGRQVSQSKFRKLTNKCGLGDDVTSARLRIASTDAPAEFLTAVPSCGENYTRQYFQTSEISKAGEVS
jgi:hypothetical protein